MKTIFRGWRERARIPAARVAVACAAAAVTLLAAAPAHALFEDDDARRAIIDMRGKVELQRRETETRLNDLSARVDSLAARLDQADKMSQGRIELQNQIEALRREVATLRGLVETQANEIAKTQQQQRTVLDDVDSRLKRFEPVQVEIDGKTVAVDPDEKSAYDAALAQFRAGDFSNSLTAFKQFSTRYPSSPYAANVQFWTGNGQYAMKDFKSAIATHQSLIAKHPDFPRVPDALLNIGYAQAESGDKRAARKTLETVISRYPGTNVANLANERLATLK